MTKITINQGLILPALLSLLVSFSATAHSADYETAAALEATQRSTLAGYTRARATMQVISQVSDRLLEVRGDVGDTIGADGVLAVIDSTMAELDLESILLNQKKLTGRITYLQKEVARFATLLKTQATAEAKFESLEQDLDQAQLGLQALKNDENKSREILARHIVSAPSGWRVISRSAEPGKWISAGSVLGEVGDFRTLIVPFALDHQEYEWLKKNSGRLTLWLPEQNIHATARILRVSPDFDQITRKLNLEMEITSKLSDRRGGIRAELTVETPDPSGAVIVPEEALSSRYDSFWITTPAGEKMSVIKLGPGPAAGTVRILSPQIRPGDRFRMNNHSQENTALKP